MSGVSYGEAYISDPCQLEPLALIIPCLGDGSLQRGEKKLRTLGSDGSEERVLVGEMVIRSGFRYAGDTRDGPQRETLGSDFR
jgi:hypothetical protein